MSLRERMNAAADELEDLTAGWTGSRSSKAARHSIRVMREFAAVTEEEVRAMNAPEEPVLPDFDNVKVSAASVLGSIERAAGPVRGAVDIGAVVEPHPYPDDISTLLHQQRRSCR